MSYENREATLTWAQELMASRPPDFYVGPSEDHQVDRWFVVPRNTYRNVYLHRFYRSDDQSALHDHPWDSMSWILSGRYREVMATEAPIREEGSISERLARQPHRIELLTPEPVITLFFTGPTCRWRVKSEQPTVYEPEWGFHCANGWRFWRDYVEQLADGGNREGRGCG